MYRINLKSQAEKFLDKKLDRKTQLKVSAKIDQLALDPFAPHPNLDKLHDMPHGYRLRIGDIRLIYEVDTASQIIIVWKIDWRGSAYKP